MFGKLVPVPSGAVIPERDIGKRPIQIGRASCRERV